MNRPQREVTVEALAQSGEGIARLDGRPVLVPGTLPGERARVYLSRAGRVAELAELVAPSPERRTPPCPMFQRCGGCAWQHAPAALQREARLTQLRRALPATMREVLVEYVPAPAEYHYRGRARLAWRADGLNVALGFRASGAHDVVDAPGCLVLVEVLSEALAPLRPALARVSAAGEAHLARGANGAAVVTLRPAEPMFATGYEAPEQLVAHGFAGAELYAPGATAAVIAGDPRPMIEGADGAPLRLAPGGFAQANEALNSALARYVARVAAPAGASVLELYAGAGNFTVMLAPDARRVTAVESDRAASAALVENVRARGLANVTSVHDDAAHAAVTRRADVVVLDPPRTGAREACIAFARTPPRRIVYVSCDPATLGRDLALLSAAFELRALAAFEMFPQTPHVEAVALLERRRG